MGPLMEEGKMPNLSRLAARGARGPLRSIEPMESPALWTTVATGVSPTTHGISGFYIGDRELTSRDRLAQRFELFRSAN